MKLEWINWGLWTTYVPSACSKFIPGLMGGLWPTLPSWFWPLVGVWEATGTYFLYKGEYEYAFPMMYLFMGGVLASLTTIPDKKGTPLIKQFGVPVLTPFVYGTGLILLKADRVGEDLKMSLPYLAGGFVIGNLIAMTGPKAKSK